MGSRHLSALVLLVPAMALQACGGCNKEDDSKPNTQPPAEAHDIGEYLSMAVMPDGTPAVSYYDRTSGALAFALWQSAGESGSWKEERIDGYADETGLDRGDRGKYTSLAITSGGTAWISYYDATNGNLFYAKRDGANKWTTGVADTGGGATPNAGQFTSIALDANENPVISHYDVNRKELRVTHWRDTAFAGESVDAGEDYVPEDSALDPVEADVGKYSSLLIKDGTEYIAYYDAAAGDLKLATGTAGNYSIEVVDSEGDVGAWPSMMFDGSDLLIAYQDVGNQDLKFGRRSGGTWTLETVDNGEFIGADTELFMNGSYPAIVYFDGNENNMKLAQSTGGSWTLDTLAGSDGALGFHNETVLTQGKRFIGCYDYTNRTIWFSEL